MRLFICSGCVLIHAASNGHLYCSNLIKSRVSLNMQKNLLEKGRWLVPLHKAPRLVQGLWPLVMGRECLRRSTPGEIMVDSWEGLPVQARYFRLMDAEFPLRLGRLGPAEAEMTALQVPGLS